MWNLKWFKGCLELFVDLLVGLFIRNILKLRGVPENLSMISVMAWLFNPFTFTIGTRGNCEPIVCALILWVFICLMNGVSFFLCTCSLFVFGIVVSHCIDSQSCFP